MIFKLKSLIILLAFLFVRLTIISAQIQAQWDSAVSKLPLSPNVASLSKLTPKPATKSYHLGVHFRLNWYESHLFCRRYGMELLTLSTKKESDDIISYLANQGIPKSSFWTAGVDLNEEGRFYWMSNGELLRFTNWDARQPDNAGQNEHCIELHGNTWNDLPCHERIYFICEGY